MPEPGWQEFVLSQAFLVVGAATRFVVAWFGHHTARLKRRGGYADGTES